MKIINYKISSGKVLILGNQFDHRVYHVDFDDFHKIHEDSDVYLKIAGRGIFKLDGIGFDVTQRFTLENIKMVGQLMELHENPDGDLSTITPDDGQTLYENIVDNEAAVKRFDVINHSPIFYMRVLESVDENTEIIESEYEYIFWRDRLNHIVSEIEEHIQNGDFDGEDGFSPIVSMEKSNGRLTLQITDKNGEHTAFISDGKDGESVGIDRIEESTEPEGISAVYFTDGKVLYIKNGKDGTDYVITAADKEEIAEIAKQKALDATYDKQTIDEKIAEATPEDYDQVKENVQNIQNVIPDQASEDNQLADKDFVNSSVANNTAFFIGVFNSVAELEAYSGTLTNNDYAFVIAQDADGNTLYKRYKYNASTAEWMFEFDLNNSSFTAAQWASIQSGITGALVEKLNGIEAGAQKNPADYASVKKQVEDNTSELHTQKEDFSNGLAQKIDKPSDAPTVGKVLKVMSVNEDGTFVVGWADSVSEIPIASNTTIGGVKVSSVFGYQDDLGDGTLRGATRTAQQYKDGYNSMIICKGTLENIIPQKVKSVMSSTTDPAWTSDEQLAARQRLGVENKFELIEEINISSGKSIARQAEPNGTPYNLKRLRLIIISNSSSAITANIYINDTINLLGSLANAFPVNGTRMIDVSVVGGMLETKTGYVPTKVQTSGYTFQSSSSIASFTQLADSINKFEIYAQSEINADMTVKIYGIRA